MRNVFAIADLHLSSSKPKPMNVFGPRWEDHVERVEHSWRENIGYDDIVLIAGDISWAMNLVEVRPDFEWMAALPGEKVILKGNHDYWWSSLAQIRQMAGERFHFIQNNVIEFDEVVIGGTRLWDFPGISWPLEFFESRSESIDGAVKSSKADRNEADQERIRQRELGRLERSLEQMPLDGRRRFAMVHYPPVGADGLETSLTRLIASFKIDLCVYGHLHALRPLTVPGTNCSLDGTRYLLTSCDWLNCTPLKIAEL